MPRARACAPESAHGMTIVSAVPPCASRPTACAPQPKHALPSPLPCDAGRTGNEERLPHHAASPTALSVEASVPDVFWRLAKISWSPFSALVGSLAALVMLRPRLLMAMGLSVITHNAPGHNTIFSVIDLYYAFPCFFLLYAASTFHVLSTSYVSDILGIYELLALGDLKPDIYVNISIWN